MLKKIRAVLVKIGGAKELVVDAVVAENYELRSENAQLKFENEQLKCQIEQKRLQLLLSFELKNDYCIKMRRYKLALARIEQICEASEHIRTNDDLVKIENIAFVALRGDNE